jgi:hypothetical protein
MSDLDDLAAVGRSGSDPLFARGPTLLWPIGAGVAGVLG